MVTSLSILIASSGRPTLKHTLDSFVSQLFAGDEIIVDVNDDSPWGHRARNRMMLRAKGTHLAFMDDDDMYTPGSIAAIHDAIDRAPGIVHIFKMRYQDGSTIWSDRRLIGGNVSTQMFIVPNVPGKLGRWGDRYEGDFDFIHSTVELQEGLGYRFSTPPKWHPTVIAEYGRVK